MEQNITFEWHSVEDLQPYEHNARKHDTEDVEAIKKSIEQFGFNDPIGIWSDENLIVEGHGRLLAAKELGMEEVPCIRLDHLSDEERRAYALAHNKTAELSAWDFNTLDLELAGIEEIDMSQFGFDSPVEELEAVEDDYEPEIPEEPRTKVGDLYQLGKHRLICGDATDVDVIDRLMGGQRADIGFTSPPYNVGNNAKLDGNTHMKDCKYLSGEDDISGYIDLLTGATDNTLLNCRWSFINLQILANNKTDIIEWLNEHRESLCDIAIWYKTTTAPAMASKVMNSQFEFVFIFSNESTSRAIGTNPFRGTVSNVYEGSPQRSNEFAAEHSATFPIALPSHFIQNFTNPGDSVLDVFGGTGTTMIACEQLKRKCYMSELEPRYCDIIIDRWETLTGEKAILINDKENMD